jgi:transposase
MGVLHFQKLWVHPRRDARKRLDEGAGWPGYRVYQHEINEAAKTLKLWVRREGGNRKLVCSGCGRKFTDAYEREVRDLPWSDYRTTVLVELDRVRCPDCGIKTETRRGWDAGNIVSGDLGRLIPQEHVCRVIDTFVDRLDMAGGGREDPADDTGRPGYDPSDLLRLYLYGYLQQLRSPRRLENECRRTWK